MTSYLPSLTSVRSFEAAARNKSITAAANELCVTPAAVTHQVRSLERWLGIDLFDRKGSTLTLTAAGDIFFVGVNKGIEAIRAAVEQITAPSEGASLSLVAPPSFASQWLVPRLSKFQPTPKVQLSLAIRTVSPSATWNNTDVGIVLGVETPSFVERRPLMSYRIIAVCSPKLLEGPRAIRTVDDLRHHQLLHDVGLKNIDGLDWSTWLRHFGFPALDTSGGIHFNNAFTAYKFAVDGHGVVLAKDVLVHDQIERGELVALFDAHIQSKYTYDFACSAAAYHSKPVNLFWKWLSKEVVSGGFAMA